MQYNTVRTIKISTTKMSSGNINFLVSWISRNFHEKLYNPNAAVCLAVFLASIEPHTSCIKQNLYPLLHKQNPEVPINVIGNATECLTSICHEVLTP
jgi:hypothetical protein